MNCCCNLPQRLFNHFLNNYIKTEGETNQYRQYKECNRGRQPLAQAMADTQKVTDNSFNSLNQSIIDDKFIACEQYIEKGNYLEAIKTIGEINNKLEELPFDPYDKKPWEDASNTLSTIALKFIEQLNDNAPNITPKKKDIDIVKQAKGHLEQTADTLSKAIQSLHGHSYNKSLICRYNTFIARIKSSCHKIDGFLNKIESSEQLKTNNIDHITSNDSTSERSITSSQDSATNFTVDSLLPPLMYPQQPNNQQYATSLTTPTHPFFIPETVPEKSVTLIVV